MKKTSYLDRMRLSQSSESFRRSFCELVMRSKAEALSLMNDDNLQYPCLFLLKAIIDEMDLHEQLNQRNKAAVRVWTVSSNDRYGNKDSEQPLPRDAGTTRDALRWILDTGAYWNAPGEDENTYDAAIDTAALTLIGTLSDTSVLPVIVGLIFERNQKNLFIHDLVWCFYQANDIDSYRMIARYLLSRSPKDTELACRLLHLQQPENSGADKRKLYNDYLAWLNSNEKYIYFTGEAFQLTSDPEPLKINLEAKYLCREIPPRRGKASLEALNENEARCLNVFRGSSEYEQKILATYSNYIHNRDFDQWRQWMLKRGEEHIRAAAADMEAMYDYSRK